MGGYPFASGIADGPVYSIRDGKVYFCKSLILYLPLTLTMTPAAAVETTGPFRWR
jgi:hypothetical protein